MMLVQVTLLMPSASCCHPVMPCSQHRMLAAESVQEGALLLQVPEQLMLSANTALKSKLCGKLVRDAELSEWQVGRNILHG